MKSGLKFSIYLLIITIFFSCSDKAVNYYNQGVSAAADDDMEKAIFLWNKSLKYRTNDPDVYFNLGNAYLATHNFKEAEKNFRKTVDLNRNDHISHYKLGLSLQSQDKCIEAKASYKFSIRLKTNYLPPYLGIAECALSNNNINTAEKYASLALGLSPRNIKANILFADVLFRKGQYEQAYMQIIELRNSGNIDLLTILGKIMYERQMYKEAIETLSEARYIGETNSEIFLYLGKSALKLKRYHDAKNYFKLSIFKNRKESSAWAGLGEVYGAKLKWSEAIKAYSKAQDFAPDNNEILGNFGILLLKSGRNEKALKKLEVAVSRMDSPGRFLYYLGRAYMKTGNNKLAEETFNKFIENWDGDEKYIIMAEDIIKELK